MEEPTRGNERPQGGVNDFIDLMTEAGLPPELFPPELVQRAFQVNRALLQRYHGMLGREGDESLMQHKELVKALMACCLELGKAFRTYRDSVISAQAALVTRYLELLEHPEKGDASRE